SILEKARSQEAARGSPPVLKPSGQNDHEDAKQTPTGLSDVDSPLGAGSGLCTGRDIGSGGDRGFEQSVGMFVDGVFAGRDQQFAVPFFDLQRVEVLKGPQSILFGKNTIAGAVNITTAGPTTEPRASLTAE